MGSDWEYYNKLGLAPKNTTHGPALVRKLVTMGIID